MNKIHIVGATILWGSIHLQASLTLASIQRMRDRIFPAEQSILSTELNRSQTGLAIQESFREAIKGKTFLYPYERELLQNISWQANPAACTQEFVEDAVTKERLTLIRTSILKGCAWTAVSYGAVVMFTAWIRGTVDLPANYLGGAMAAGVTSMILNAPALADKHFLKGICVYRTKPREVVAVLQQIYTWQLRSTLDSMDAQYEAIEQYVPACVRQQTQDVMHSHQLVQATWARPRLTHSAYINRLCGTADRWHRYCTTRQ